jgi:4-hydroxy-tetrahydrodipicolinate reductase
MKTRVCLAGATGWVGKALSKAIVHSTDLSLVGAIARESVGQRLGDIVGVESLDLQVSASLAEALDDGCDVLIDYTHPSVVKAHVEAALDRKVAVVIGTSGLSDEDYREIDVRARNVGVGVLAAGNFAITAVLLQRFAVEAAKYVPHWEIIDYATDEKPDAPAGTTRELAAKLATVREPTLRVPVETTIGARESRGAKIMGSQIHSVRLPGYVFGFEITFGLAGERLLLRHDAGTSAEPYVAGTLMAVRRVNHFVGLRRGLASVMDD